MAVVDHVRGVVYSTLGTILSAGVLTMILWLKGLPLHWALLVTAGFVLALSIAAYLITAIIQHYRHPPAEKLPTTPDNELQQQAISLQQGLDTTKAELTEERDKVVRAMGDSRAWERKYHELNIVKVAAQNERDGLQNRVSELTIRLGTTEANHTLQVEELNSKIDAKIEEIKTAKQKAEHERIRADSEARDKGFERELKERAENRLNELDSLIRLAGDQAQHLSDHISVEIVTDPQCGELQLTGNDLCVLLVVGITNQSVFEIAIEEKKIRGQFSLSRVAFKEKAEQLIDDFRAPLHNLKPKQREFIIIEQPLRTFEAEKIQRCLDDPDAKFWVGGVRIPISINNPGFEVKNEPDLLWGNAAEVPLKYFKRNTDNT
jgi:hypothetical protein